MQPRQTFGVHLKPAFVAGARQAGPERALGIEHSGLRHIDEPMKFSTLVLQDPEDIQLELFTLR